MERDAAEYKHVVLALIFLRQCSLRRSFRDLSRAAHSRKFSAVCRAFRVASSESNPIDEGVCDELALRRIASVRAGNFRFGFVRFLGLSNPGRDPLLSVGFCCSADAFGVRSRLKVERLREFC